MFNKRIIIILLLVCSTVFAFSLYPSESSIPPTNAVTNIATNDTYINTGGWVNSTSYRGNVYIISDGSIILEPTAYNGGAE